MYNNIIENLLDTFKMSMLVNARDSNNFIYYTVFILLTTCVLNNREFNDYIKEFFSNINLFLIKNRKNRSITIEGKVIFKDNEYSSRIQNLFSNKFTAIWKHICSNSLNNTKIYNLKEFSDIKYDMYAKYNYNVDYIENDNMTKDDIAKYNIAKYNYIVDQDNSFKISDDIYCSVKIENNSNSDKKDSIMQTIRIKIYSNKLSLSKLAKYIDDIEDNYLNSIKIMRENRKYIYTLTGNSKNNDIESSNDVWNECEFKSYRTFNNIFFDSKKKLLNKINFFENNKEWYQYEGHPYTLGIGLHGPPGTGKTSIIKCIANKLNRHIIIIPLNKNFINFRFFRFFRFFIDIKFNILFCHL